MLTNRKKIKKKEIIEINPVGMNFQEKKILTEFLNHKQDIIFIQDKPYEYNNITLSFLYPLIKRPCHPIGKHKGEYRYEVISVIQIGAGSYSHIYTTEGTLVPPKTNHELFFFKKKPARKTRLVKIEKNIDLSDTKYKRKIYREYLLTSPELHMKMPVFFNNNSFLFMRRLFEKNLENFLRYDRDMIITAECLTLGLAILKAGKTQLKNRQIVHRDLKPENIIVDYNKSSKKWTIIIIDYGLAKFIDKNDINKSVGNFLYMSPECYHAEGTNFNSDMYSFGCILSEIFGCDRRQSIIEIESILTEFKSQINLNYLFSNTILNNSSRSLLKELILNMTKPNPLFRCSIEKAIIGMEKIITEYNKSINNTIINNTPNQRRSFSNF